MLSQKALKKGIELLGYLSGLERQVISFWRARLFYQREAPFIGDQAIDNRIGTLLKFGLITPLHGGRAPLWQADTPYLSKQNNIYELANEAYPTASLAYSTALEIHRLTDQRFTKIHLCEPRTFIHNIPNEPDDIADNVIPPDTQLNDWQINDAPHDTNLTEWNEYTILPHQTKGEWIFGTTIAETGGVKVRTSSLEKTLIDGLKKPRYCGGLDEVFKAWVRGLDGINVKHIVAYTEQYDRSILYQRVGYVCEKLGLYHRRFSHWKQHHAPRGGSRVLNPHHGFESTYDSTWNLSINHPVSILNNKDSGYS